MIAECTALTCVGRVAPLYNVALVLILFYLLLKLIRLKKTHKSVYLKPWYYMFAAVSIFLLESIITSLKFFNVVSEEMIPRLFNAVFELCIIALGIYLLFTQLDYLKKTYRTYFKKKN